MKKIFKSKLLLAALLAIPGFALFADPIRLVGSDVVGEKISAKISDYAKSRNIDLKINMVGTRDSIAALNAGNADIAIVALLKGQKKLEGFQYVPYTHQVAAIIVNKANPLEEISVDQLKFIFGMEGQKGELSDEEKAPFKNILAISTNLKESLALELFKSKCLNNSNISSKVEIKESTKRVTDTVRNSGSAIGIASFDPKLPDVKVLAVLDKHQDKENSIAFKPTAENVHNGDYPMSLDFYVVYKAENTQKFKGLLQILYDEKVQEILETSGFVVSPKNFQKAFLLGLDIGK